MQNRIEYRPLYLPTKRTKASQAPAIIYLPFLAEGR